MNTIEVSPAFSISKWGEDFTMKDYSNAVPVVKRLGFSVVQLEIYSKESLSEWKSGVESLAHEIKEEGLYISQFVAHLHMSSFMGSRIDKDEVTETFKRVLGTAEKFQMEQVITVPAGSPKENLNIAPGSMEYKGLQKQMEETVRLRCETAYPSGFKIALEILPGSLVGGVEAFTGLIKRIGMDNLGINLDTGHANVSENNVESLPLILKDRIFGTHLSDNDGIKNLSLCPGRRSINWKELFKNLNSIGYTGSLDIEIHCRAEEIESEYSSAYSYIKELLKKRGNI